MVGNKSRENQTITLIITGHGAVGMNLQRFRECDVEDDNVEHLLCFYQG